MAERELLRRGEHRPNGTALTTQPTLAPEIDDAGLMRLVRSVGIKRVLEAAE